MRLLQDIPWAECYVVGAFQKASVAWVHFMIQSHDGIQLPISRLLACVHDNQVSTVHCASIQYDPFQCPTPPAHLLLWPVAE